MTGFIVISAVMALAAIVLLVRPLLRPAVEEGAATVGSNERRLSVVLVAIAIPLVAGLLYPKLSNWDWDHDPNAATAAPDVKAMVAQLEQRMKDTPEDTQGWLMLGRAYQVMERYPESVKAYERAYDLTNGQNMEVAIGLAESLVTVDEKSLTGRAGELFEYVLTRQPANPKALWYTGVGALEAGKLELARDRFQGLLALNPPEEVRSLLERQVQDLNQQLGGQAAPAAGAVTPKPATAQQQRSIRVGVTVKPEILKQLRQPVTLFVLARDPAGGPPLAAVRRSSSDLPLTIELTERDAMMPARSIAGATQVQIVARLSLGGSPTEQPGDFFGMAEYSFERQGASGSVNIEIDRTVQ